MAYVRYKTNDRFRLRYRSLYGLGEMDKEKVPTFDTICNFRDSFHIDQMRTVYTHYKKAPSEKGVTLEKFSNRWEMERNSMMYIITEKRGNVITASPACVEVGLYRGFEHLQKLSLNCSSVDVNQTESKDEDGNVYAYCHQLYFGDVIVVLDCAFYTPESITTQKPVCTAVAYYVLKRDYEYGICMAVQDRTNYHIFKGFKDQSYPATVMTEAKLRLQLDRRSLPAAHLDQLPSIFLLNATVFLPHKKCHRFGFCFNRNTLQQDLLRELLGDVIKLSSNHVRNYMPYTPHFHLVSGSYVSQLDTTLLSNHNEDILLGLKSLRAAKIQSSSGLICDRRYAHFVIRSTSFSPDGGFYVKMASKAAISFRSLKNGSQVEIECGWLCPLIGTITNLEVVGFFKEMTIHFSHHCGYAPSSLMFQDNMVNFEKEWPEIIASLQRYAASVGVRSLDTSSAWDLLMSSEKSFHMTELGRLMLKGMGSAAKAVCKKPGNSFNLAHNNHDYIYRQLTVHPNNLSETAVKIFSEALAHTPSSEQLLVFERVLDRSIPVHTVESCFGSGKTATAAASAFGRVLTYKNSRVALIAQTNSAVDALIKSSHLDDYFNPLNYHFKDFRPLVIRSKNWKLARGLRVHPYDHKLVMHKVFVHELKTTDLRSAYGPSRRQFVAMFDEIKNSEFVHARDVLGESKWQCLRLMKEVPYTDEETYHLFLNFYRPNCFYATMDMFIAYAGSYYLPLDYYPDMIMLDESTMVQPSDLAIFSSKIEREMHGKKMQYVLFGDQKQLEPFNSIKTLAPIVISPNKILLNLRIVPSTLTTVYRCHPAAVDILSIWAYSGGLTSGRSRDTDYIQSRLPFELFPYGRSRAFHFIHNNHASVKNAQSRSNPGEAQVVLRYLKELLACGVRPSSIVVITPYTAQEEIFRQILPEGVRATTTRKYQGGESDIVLFSACTTEINPMEQGPTGTDPLEKVEDSSRIHVENDGTAKKVHYISDPSIVLVSLSRALHFTTIFGNHDFLSAIPLWKRFFELAELF